MAFINYAHRQFFVPEQAWSETKWSLRATFWCVASFCSLAWMAIIFACVEWL